MKNYVRTLTSVLGLIWAIGCSAAATPQEEGDTAAVDVEAASSDESESAIEGAALPSQSPSEVVAASSESTAAIGVASWKIYDDLQPGSLYIYGVDRDDRLVTTLRISGGAMAAETGSTMESLYPQAGRLQLDAQGNVLASELSPLAVQAFGAMASDFQTTVDASGVELQGTFACIRAGVLVGLACGGAVIGCVTSAPTIALGLLICGTGAIGCGAALQDWACACHDVCAG